MTRWLISLGVILMVAVPVYSWGDGFIVQDYRYELPSTLQHVEEKPHILTVITACYGYTWSGLREALNCPFTIQTAPPISSTPSVAEDGGHEHDYDSRPLIYRKRHFSPGKVFYDDPGKLKYPYDLDSTRRGVKGLTLDAGTGSARVEYPLPEVSGEVLVAVRLHTQDDTWYCVYPCHDAHSSWWLHTVHVGVQGLMELPDPGADDHYIKNRSPDNDHPDSVAFYFKPQHLADVYQLANYYYAHTKPSRTLSINDMSLPLGGLFDVRGDWQPPHRSHRDGTDMDINQAGIPCTDDSVLIKAAQVALPLLRDDHGTGGNTDSALWCEPGGNKHIDFERGG